MFIDEFYINSLIGFLVGILFFGLFFWRFYKKQELYIGKMAYESRALGEKLAQKEQQLHTHNIYSLENITLSLGYDACLLLLQAL